MGLIFSSSTVFIAVELHLLFGRRGGGGGDVILAIFPF